MVPDPLQNYMRFPYPIASSDIYLRLTVKIYLPNSKTTRKVKFTLSFNWQWTVYPYLLHFRDSTFSGLWRQTPMALGLLNFLKQGGGIREISITLANFLSLIVLGNSSFHMKKRKMGDWWQYRPFSTIFPV